MIETIKRYVWALSAIVALWAALALFLLPGIAEAQEDAQSTNQDADATTVVQQQPAASEELAVHPVVWGDSLWSIAQQQLGPNASPQQTADEVERIYELNRQLIGEDPNLLLPGQELLVAQSTDTEPAVRPVVWGDSLWSIAQQQLGPNATPEQTMDEAERIYELNQQLIGEDPDLLLAGQELLVAPSTEPTATDTSATEFTTTTEEEPATAKQQPEPKDEPVPEQANGWAYNRLTLLLSFGLFVFALAVAVLGVWRLLRTRRLIRERYEHYYGTYDRLHHLEERKADEPTTADVAPAPDRSAEGSQTSKTRWGVWALIAVVALSAALAVFAPVVTEMDVLSLSAELYPIDRKLVGVGIIVLSGCLAILMAWKLPMKRAVEPPMVWRTPYTRRKASVVPTSRAPVVTTQRGPSSGPGDDGGLTNDESDAAPPGRSIGEKVDDSKRHLRTTPLRPPGGPRNRRRLP